MLDNHSKENSNKISIGKLQEQKKTYLKLKNQSKQSSNSSFRKKAIPNEKQKDIRIKSIQIKDYKLKLSNLHSVSQNKFKKRRSSILSNIYRPISQNQNQNSIKNYLNFKNINLIKQNLKKLETKFPSKVNSLGKDFKKYRITRNSSFQNSSKTLRNRIQSANQESIFLFQRKSSEKKRKLSLHFDRSKYFNCETLLKQEPFKNNLFHRQKTESRQSENFDKQREIKRKIKENQNLYDEVVPIIKQRNNKPKTAGGFLKKYAIQQVSNRPDFMLYLTEEDLV